jgi:hypothetical protein
VIVKTTITHSDISVGFVTLRGLPLTIGYQPEVGFVVWSDTGLLKPHAARETHVELRITGAQAPYEFRYLGTASPPDGSFVLHAFTRDEAS